MLEAFVVGVVAAATAATAHSDSAGHGDASRRGAVEAHELHERCHRRQK